MSTFEIKKASRQGFKPLVCLYSESGCGKTLSALLLARGFVGPQGKIGMVDTESGRGSLYADVLPGGYDILQLSEPFSPARHIEAIRAIETSGSDIGILDSGSHEWEGLGSVCDMAAQNEEKNGKSLNTWRIPKMEHAKFLNRLLQSSIPWIVCLRAKYKTRQITGTEDMSKAGVIKQSDVGKKVVLKDEATSPIQAEDFIFEATLHAEILPKHNIIVTKSSHPTLRECFPKDRDGMISKEHGEALARWCQAAGATTKPASKPAGDDPRKSKAAELWKLLKGVRGEDNNWMGAETWLVGHKIITDKQTVLELTIEELQEVIIKSKIVLEEQQST